MVIEYASDNKCFSEIFQNFNNATRSLNFRDIIDGISSQGLFLGFSNMDSWQLRFNTEKGNAVLSLYATLGLTLLEYVSEQ